MYPELGRAVKSDSGIAQFVNRYDTVTQSPDLRSETDRWLAERMRLSGMLYASFESGKEQGAYITRLETAKALRGMNFPFDVIEKATGLPLSTIQDL
jgi:hypothetical protein